jgi:nitrogenase molybdenum-iron protein alpha/beta subunit
MPMAAVTAVDYGRLLREIMSKYKKPSFEFKNKSLSGDWMDGYSEFGKVIASNMEIKKVKRQKRSVAIIGYLFDRNEYDNLANISELKRIFEGIGVKVVSIWFDGSNFFDLKSVSKAELILSFGYLKDAANILSERLKIPLIETDYPIGFEQTNNILKMVAEYFGIRNYSNFIERETKDIVRRVEPLIEQYFMNIKVFYCGDPIMYNAIKSLVELLGMSVEYAIISNTSEKASYIKQTPRNIIFEPSINQVFEVGLKMAKKDKIDLYVGNSDVSSYFIGSGKAVLEIGFPSYFSHFIAEVPYVGYKGFIHIVDRIVKELRFAEVRRVFKDQQI